MRCECVVLGRVVQASACKRKAWESKTGALALFSPLSFYPSLPFPLFLFTPAVVWRLMLVQPSRKRRWRTGEDNYLYAPTPPSKFTPHGNPQDFFYEVTDRYALHYTWVSNWRPWRLNIIIIEETKMATETSSDLILICWIKGWRMASAPWWSTLPGLNPMSVVTLKGIQDLPSCLGSVHVLVCTSGWRELLYKVGLTACTEITVSPDLEGENDRLHRVEVWWLKDD